MVNKPLRQRLADAFGFLPDDFDRHATDLYVRVEPRYGPTLRAAVVAWLAAYVPTARPRCFRSEIDGCVWLDIPFAAVTDAGGTGAEVWAWFESAQEAAAYMESPQGAGSSILQPGPRWFSSWSLPEGLIVVSGPPNTRLRIGESARGIARRFGAMLSAYSPVNLPRSAAALAKHDRELPALVAALQRATQPGASESVHTALAAIDAAEAEVTDTWAEETGNRAEDCRGRLDQSVRPSVAAWLGR